MQARFRQELNAINLCATEQRRVDVNLPRLNAKFPFFEDVFRVGIEILCAAGSVIVGQDKVAAQRPVRHVETGANIALGKGTVSAAAVLVVVAERTVIDKTRRTAVRVVFRGIKTIVHRLCGNINLKRLRVGQQRDGGRRVILQKIMAGLFCIDIQRKKTCRTGKVIIQTQLPFLSHADRKRTFIDAVNFYLHGMRPRQVSLGLGEVVGEVGADTAGRQNIGIKIHTGRRY